MNSHLLPTVNSHPRFTFTVLGSVCARVVTSKLGRWSGFPFSATCQIRKVVITWVLGFFGQIRPYATSHILTDMPRKHLLSSPPLLKGLKGDLPFASLARPRSFRAIPRISVSPRAFALLSGDTPYHGEPSRTRAPAILRITVSCWLGAFRTNAYRCRFRTHGLSIRAPRPPPVTSALNLLRLTSHMHGPTQRPAPIPRRDWRRHLLKPIKDNTISRYTPDVFPTTRRLLS